MSAAAPGAGPAVEVLIPTWNGSGRLRRALQSLRAQTLRPAVCVIDNGSTDETPRLLAAEHPEVRVVRLPRNHGYGGALNRGVEPTGPRLLVFLNDDVVADPELIARLEAAQRESGAQMVAATLLGRDGRIDSAGIVVDQSLVAYDLLHGHAHRRGDPPPPGARPLAPCGGAGAYTREAFLGAGGFDEQIFAYLEDVELGIRMRLAGMACRAAPDAIAWHEHSATLGGGTSAKNELLGRSRGYLLWKYGAGLPWRARARGLLIDAIVAAGKLAIDRNLGFARGRLDALRRHPRRTRPSVDLGSVPMVEIGTIEALRRRLGRRLPAGRGEPPPASVPIE